jgi:AcrR family transcriptional regulator
MEQASTETIEDSPRKAAPRNTGKKRELALHALSSLAELGFARMNLRDVAQRSGVSLGVIHYYFENKTALLTHCVGLYKEDFVKDIKALIRVAPSLETLSGGVADFLADTVGQHAQVHRLWYDVRAQAQFDTAFHACVAEIELALIDIFDALLTKLQTLGVKCKETDPLRLYILIDGWFRYFLQQQLRGAVEAPSTFRVKILEEFNLLVA